MMLRLYFIIKLQWDTSHGKFVWFFGEIGKQGNTIRRLFFPSSMLKARIFLADWGNLESTRSALLQFVYIQVVFVSL